MFVFESSLYLSTSHYPESDLITYRNTSTVQAIQMDFKFWKFHFILNSIEWCLFKVQAVAGKHEFVLWLLIAELSASRIQSFSQELRPKKPTKKKKKKNVWYKSLFILHFPHWYFQALNEGWPCLQFEYPWASDLCILCFMSIISISRKDYPPGWCVCVCVCEQVRAHEH